MTTWNKIKNSRRLKKLCKTFTIKFYQTLESIGTIPSSCYDLVAPSSAVSSKKLFCLRKRCQCSYKTTLNHGSIVHYQSNIWKALTTCCASPVNCVVEKIVRLFFGIKIESNFFFKLWVVASLLYCYDYQQVKLWPASTSLYQAKIGALAIPAASSRPRRRTYSRRSVCGQSDPSSGWHRIQHWSSWAPTRNLACQ